MDLVVKGLTNEEIGGVLGISSATVKTHVAAILSTLDVSNRTEATAVYRSSIERVTTILARPSIAVLPLRALTDGASALAAGLTQDLSALFSRWCWFPVVTGGDARFLVGGTLRLQAATWRLSFEVTDTETHACVWTDHYDFSARAVFDVQDEVAASVMAATYPLLIERVRHSVDRHPVPAWEQAHSGMRLQRQRDERSTAGALHAFADALAQDDRLVLAHFGRGLCAYDEILNQWGDERAAYDRLTRAAERCIALAPHGAEGHFLLARYHQTRGDHGSAARTLETAIALNPSFAHAHALLAQTLHLAGRLPESLVRMQHALRLSPRAFVAGLATLRFARSEYAEALEAAETAVALAPRYTFARVLAASAAYQLGDLVRAKHHFHSLHTDCPPFQTQTFLRTFGAKVQAVAQIEQALRALGSHVSI